MERTTIEPAAPDRPATYADIEKWLGAGDLRAAGDAIGAMMARNPDNLYVNYLAGLLAYKRADFKLAETLLAGVTRARPEHLHGHYYRGLALKELDRFDDAIEAFRTALKLRPGFAHAQQQLDSLGVPAVPADGGASLPLRTAAELPGEDNVDEYERRYYLKIRAEFRAGMRLLGEVFEKELDNMLAVFHASYVEKIARSSGRWGGNQQQKLRDSLLYLEVCLKILHISRAR